MPRSNAGVRDIILGIGGSATVDGGIGALQALGFGFFDRRGRPVGWGGNGLKSIARIDMQKINPLLEQARILVACDVDNPLVGPRERQPFSVPKRAPPPEWFENWTTPLAIWAGSFNRRPVRMSLLLPALERQEALPEDSWVCWVLSYGPAVIWCSTC